MGAPDSLMALFDTKGPPWRPEVGDRVFVVSVRMWGTVVATFFQQTGTGTHVRIDGVAEASWVDLADLAPEPTSYREA